MGQYCDLLVDDDADPALAGVTACPAAAVLLAQLTRRTDGTAPSRRALVAESLAYAASRAGLSTPGGPLVLPAPLTTVRARSTSSAPMTTPPPSPSTDPEVHNALGVVMRTS